MSALNGTDQEDGLPSSSKNLKGILVGFSRLAAALIQCALLAVALECMGQQKASKASADFQQVEALIQQHRLNEAKAKALDELQKYPSSVEGYNLLGIIQSNQQDYAGAIQSFKKALQLSPNFTKTHNNLGNAYVAQRELDAAEKEFRTVLRLDPANPTRITTWASS